MWLPRVLAPSVHAAPCPQTNSTRIAQCTPCPLRALPRGAQARAWLGRREQGKRQQTRRRQPVCGPAPAARAVAPPHARTIICLSPSQPGTMSPGRIASRRPMASMKAQHTAVTARTWGGGACVAKPRRSAGRHTERRRRPGNGRESVSGSTDEETWGKQALGGRTGRQSRRGVRVPRRPAGASHHLEPSAAREALKRCRRCCCTRDARRGWHTRLEAEQ